MATLNKFFTNVLIFGLAMNIILYLYGIFSFSPPDAPHTGSLTTMTSWFDLSPFNLLFTGATAAIVGVASLLLKQGTYAIYAMLLAALGMIITPIQAFIIAIPTTLNYWLPISTNPNPSLYSVNPLVVVISLIFVFGAYWFIFGLVVQREVS